MKSQSGISSRLGGIKVRARSAQAHVALSVNRALSALYWDIGQLIVKRQQIEGSGSSIVNSLGKDMQADFSGLAAFSAGNIGRMWVLYRAWSSAKSAQAAHKLKPNEKLAQAARDSRSRDGSNLAQSVRGLMPAVARIWLELGDG